MGALTLHLIFFPLGASGVTTSVVALRAEAVGVLLPWSEQAQVRAPWQERTQTTVPFLENQQVVVP